VSPAGRDSVFVLLHSPLLGPTTWSPVVRELKRRGREAVTPSLAGMADAPAPHWGQVAEAVRAETERVKDPVLLGGHSAAGVLLPMIAGELTAEVVGLIFVDGFLPPTSGSTRLAPLALVDQLRGLASDRVLPPWWSWFGEETMRELVPNGSLRAVLEDEMPRLPLSYLEESVPVPDRWGERACAYLLFSPETQGESAADARRRGWPVTELRGAHHLAMVTEPTAVTDALLQLERELG
jgi:Alpha/beta hydrolase family